MAACVGVVVWFVLLVICRCVLCVGILLDALPGGSRFAPKLIWAVLVLLGGVLPLAAYWLIHHSLLARSSEGVRGLPADPNQAPRVVPQQ